MTADELFYRLRQFWRGFRAHITHQEIEKAAGILSPAAFALFQRLPVDGQRHSLNVLATLETKGTVPLDLAAAALLHDVGKVAATEAGLEINLWWRGPLVVLETFAPTLLVRLSSSQVRHGWRYLLYVHLDHPRIGAEWAAACGCSDLTCWLIAHHQDKLDGKPTTIKEELLTQLQWADSQN
jgi:hypothetical protein